jgi:alkylhydroperoxidase/carboxymuconolactone decarboxylase family protein YurZ
MAMAIALGAGCRNGVLGQATYALENGATTEEFLETISVVVSMRGTTGIAESLRIIQYLDELDKLVPIHESGMGTDEFPIQK